MQEKVAAYMEQYQMFPQNGQIVAGISGGADSVCLLAVLARLRSSRGFCLTAVYVDHGLRKEAQEDAAFVKKLCEEWEVPFVLVQADVARMARDGHFSVEEAGRRARYDAFANTLQKVQQGRTGGCIAVAHNRDDRAETLLFHLIRGTGLRGMGSIRPVRDAQDKARIIRPLLFLGRAEIEDWLNREGLCWRVDRTNLEDVYTRNKIRNRLLPYAEKEICSAARQNLSREAQLFSQAGAFVDRMTREALERCAVREGAGIRFQTAAFAKEDPFLQDQMLYQSLWEIGKGKDLTAAHVAQVKRLFLPTCQSGRKVELPVCDIAVRREFDSVRVMPRDGEGSVKRAQKEDIGEEIALKPGRFWVPGLGAVTAKLLDAQSADPGFLQNIPEKKYTKWFDYDRIRESLRFRTRRSRDYLTVDSALHQKSLKRYMIQERIPADQRETLMVLADGAHIVWVPGHRISAAYKVTEDTSVILEVSVEAVTEEKQPMAERVEVMFTEQEVNERIRQLGEQISRDYEGRQVHLVCVLKGGCLFFGELAKRIRVPVFLDFISISSYGDDTRSSGVVRIEKDLEESLKDKDVIVVEDIVDSGRSMSCLLDMLRARGPKSLALCALLDKPDRREREVKVDYTGFVIPDEFVVGYGLDYAQRYRNLPYIGIIRFDEKKEV